MNKKILNTILMVCRYSFHCFLLLSITLSTALAEEGLGQAVSVREQKITVEDPNMKIGEVFSFIEKKTAYKFIYTDKTFDKDLDVELSTGNQTVADVLIHVAKQSRLRFRQVNELISVKREETASASQIVEIVIAEGQSLQVTGKVFDESGQPLPGANVLEKGTANGTATDLNGQYTLTVSDENATLVISFIGYLTEEVAVNGRSVIDVSLTLDIASLQEVVVVGYGEQQKSDVTGAIATVSPERLDQKPNVNFTQALQGAIPGVNISLNQAGAESNNVNLVIRGQRSLAGQDEPLIILDGVPFQGNISEINSADVESVNVLKDASATAIYGSRAAFGVIIITTKKGQAGKPRVTYNGYYGFNENINVPDVYDGNGFADFKVARFRNSDGDQSIPEDVILEDFELENFRNGNSVDWVDLGTQVGTKQEHTISISGGTEASSYYVAASILDIEGVAVNDKFQRANFRVNYEQSVNDWFTLGTNTRLMRIDRDGRETIFSGSQGVFSMNPLSHPFDDEGNLSIFPLAPNQQFLNPLQNTIAGDEDIEFGLFSNNYLDINIPWIDGLSYRLNTGVELTNRKRGTYFGRNTTTGVQTGGRADQSNEYDENYLVENIINYRRYFGKHSIFFTGLYSYQNIIEEFHRLQSQGFANDAQTYYQANSASQVIPSHAYTNETLISQMARVNYGYDDRYQLTFTVRRDGYTAFGQDRKFAVFPSVGFSWNADRENFLGITEDSNLSQLKFRLSYGQTGNNQIGIFSNLATLRDAPYIIGSSTAPGYIYSQLANTDLSWETTTTLNLGVDFGIIRNWVTGSLDYYRADSEDLLQDLQIPLVYPVSSVASNVGELRNEGIELLLNAEVLRAEDFSWNTSVNYSFNNNEILALANGVDRDIENGLFVGEPVSVNYGFMFDGVWQTGDGDAIVGSAQPDAEPGDVRIRDIENEIVQVSSGDSTILAITDELDRVVQGSPIPRQLWGWENTFTYKNFSLYIFVHGVADVTKQNVSKFINQPQDPLRNQIVQDFWTPENPTNDFYANRDDANVRNVRFYEDASFIRLKDITLTYNFGSDLISRLGLSSGRVFFTGRNLATITDWDGHDPELNQFGNLLPLQREFVFGLNFSF